MIPFIWDSWKAQKVDQKLTEHGGVARGLTTEKHQKMLSGDKKVPYPDGPDGYRAVSIC